MILGIDPGQSGGMVLMGSGGEIYDVAAFKNMTDHDISETISEWQRGNPDLKAYLEQVHSMPKQGVASTFKFGVSYGFLQGLLVGLKIPYEFVTPQKWQKALNCMSKGDKNVTKAAAQRRWPDRKITHAVADAMLIAEYGRITNK